MKKILAFWWSSSQSRIIKSTLLTTGLHLQLRKKIKSSHNLSNLSEGMPQKLKHKHLVLSSSLKLYLARKFLITPCDSEYIPANQRQSWEALSYRMIWCYELYRLIAPKQLISIGTDGFSPPRDWYVSQIWYISQNEIGINWMRLIGMKQKAQWAIHAKRNVPLRLQSIRGEYD